MRWLIVAASVLAVGCSSVKPLPVIAGDRCFRCQRPIDDVRLAGELIDGAGHASKFRTPGCMAKYLADHPNELYTGIFVTDHSTGKFIEAADATFARVTQSTASMEKEYLAFKDAGDAEAIAKKEGGTIATWDQVVASATTP
jgi:hypothetical protein